MSGIVGIVKLDGSPVDRALLEQMTDFMTFRGPDGQQTWVADNVGFGHTLLKTTEESEDEHQPFTLDGQVWIVADARVDAQRDLIAKLATRGEAVARGATDVELLLRAYRAWGEECVEHLLGDFAFAVWDGPRQRLFCACDHLGVKPFFYTHLSQTVIFSNTLDCIRQHPMISDKLNDQAIGDFLICGFNPDMGTTSFAEIQRVPPAHSLIVSSESRSLRRYWNLPVDEPLRYRRAEDYVERFRDLLARAVGDRLVPGPVGVFMSGGLDSSALAATAADLQSTGFKTSPLAFTSVFNRVIPDDERFYADLVAAHLRIPIRYRILDEEPFGWDPQQCPVHTPEPVENPLVLHSSCEYWKEIAPLARVFLYGEGPDNAMEYEWRPYLAHLIRRRQWWRLSSELIHNMVAHRRLPLLSTLPRMWKNQRARRGIERLFPGWIDEDFAQRFYLRQRWDEMETPSSVAHPIRPQAYGSFMTGLWSVTFASMDAGSTGVPVEVRHPFLDLRLLRFLLAIPVLPWCRKKYLLRRALRGMIPEAVRRRAKTPLTGDPTLARIWEVGLPDLSEARTLARYVNWKQLPRAFNGPHEFQPYLRVLGLNYWLNGLNG